MAVNILPLFKEQFESTLISKASELTGENFENSKSAINSIAVAFLEKVTVKTSTQKGSLAVLSLIGQHCFDEMAALISNKDKEYDFNKIMNLGLILIKNIFAQKSGALIDWVSSDSGVKSSSAASIMSMVAPFIMCPIGQQVKSNGLNAAELTAMMTDQKPFYASLLPSELAALINAPDPLTLERDVVKETKEEEQDLNLGKFLPWLLLILGLCLVWYFMRNDFRKNMAGPVMSEHTTLDTAIQTNSDTIASRLSTIDDGMVNGNVDDMGNWVAELGGEYTLQLPNGKTLKVYENSIERQLVDFILTGQKDESVLKQKWFTFDRLYFRQGKSELTEDSKLQIDNIAEILRAFTAVKIKMGGYTDSDGNEALNLKLSEERSNIARKELLKRGIASARVEAEGYGESHPLCPANDTPACKARNRRIDIRITGM